MALAPSTKNNLRSLFAEGVFKIPSYQRCYSWEEEQQEELYNDIKDAHDKNDMPHFLGTLSVQLLREEGIECEYAVIDGQQRLTTLLILYRVLVQKLEKGEKGKYEALVKQGNTYFFEPINAEDKAFLISILAQEDNKLNPKTISQSLMSEAQKQYANKTRHLDSKQAEQLIDFILNRTQFLIHLVESESESIRLFEIINARGLPLKYFDKIKSFFIFFISKNLNGDDTIKDRVQESFDKIYRFFDNKDLQLDLNKDDLLLRYHYLSNPVLFVKDWNYSVGADDMLKKIRDFLSDPSTDKKKAQKFIKDYLDDIENYIDAVYRIEEKLKTNKKFRDFYQYLKPGDRMYPFSVRLEIKGFLDKTISSLEKLEFYLRPRKNPKKDVFNILKQMMGLGDKPLTSITDVCEEIDQLRKNQPRVAVGGVKIINEEDWARKFILYKFNKEKYKQDIILSDYKKLELEHIFPQNEAPAGVRKQYRFHSPQDYEEFIQYIGNITLLEKKLNIEASKKLPVDKIGKFYGRSEIEMTREIKKFDKKEDIINRTKEIETFVIKYLEEVEEQLTDPTSD